MDLDKFQKELLFETERLSPEELVLTKYRKPPLIWSTRSGEI